ncbi:MAG: phosphoadenylyl-sulfate reductase [bacterium]|nr:phosphoadenylyl-sulfate reductase [bacterium]
MSLDEEGQAVSMLPETGSAEPVSESSNPEALVDWALHRFAGQRTIMTSAFGMEGCALIDMIARRTSAFTVVYLDTGFFFPETMTLLERLIQRYPRIDFVNRGTTLSPQEQKERYGDELWKRDPSRCCQLRKIEPMKAVMEEADVWVTGLRRSQSATRQHLRVAEWDWRYDLLKINPLANWERRDVWEYVQRHDVPFNALHVRGYPSIGCTHCTAPVEGSEVTDYVRDGRWSGQDKTECGLHGDGI